MRLLHTSDWHLGQEFHGFAREHEHQAFLAWLADTLVEQRVDALVVAGDVYDSQNPPIAAQKQLYHFIADVRRRLPKLDIVLVGGNHDSAGRLEAPGPLLEPLGVRVVGCLPRGPDGTLDAERLAVPLHDGAGKVAAWCAAVPFLRLSDLPPPEDDDTDPLIRGVRRVYADALALVRARMEAGQALVVTGHCYMTGGELSELSERRILGGNQHALPADIFPADVAYVALGHLHKAQRVGGRDGVRYSGSPLPLSVTERDYRHQVLLVELDGTAPAVITALPVPRAVEVLRVPARGAATPEDVLAQLRALAAPDDGPRHLWPYLHVAVSCAGPVPGLRRDVEEAIAGKGLRLAKIDRVDDRPAAALAPETPPDLESLHPEEVFAQVWRAAHDGEPPAEYLDAFRQLLEGLESDEAAA